MKDDRCEGLECSICICTTCMHQGFDCGCSKENDGAIKQCDFYDEMTGKQISLFD